MAHYPRPCVDSITAALIAMGVIDDSGQVITQSETTDESNSRDKAVHNNPDRSVKPRQDLSPQIRAAPGPSHGNKKSNDQKRQEAEALADIQQRVREYLAMKASSDRVVTTPTAGKRKIRDELAEDLPAIKRWLNTLAEATDG